MGHLGGSDGQASAFGSGHDPRVLGLGTLLSREPASPSPSAAPPACALSLSFCQISKSLKRERDPHSSMATMSVTSTILLCPFLLLPLLSFLCISIIQVFSKQTLVCFCIFKKTDCRGTQVSQWVKASAFGLGHDPKVLGSSPASALYSVGSLLPPLSACLSAYL